MLGFLRRLKRSLIEEGQFRKYLVYAIGEILLVMVGILLALQVNNWNQEKSIYEEQKEYLHLIRNELANNVASIEVEKKRVEATLEAQRAIISLMDPGSQFEETEFSSLWAKGFSVDIEFDFENTALTELISSGGLKNIANDSIRILLPTVESQVQNVRLQEKNLYAYWVKINDFLEKNADFRTVIDNTGINNGIGLPASSSNNSNKFILQSQEMENYLVLYLMVGGGLINLYSELQNDFQMLAGMIEEELDMSKRS